MEDRAQEAYLQWSADGTWERLLQQVEAVADAEGSIDWDVSVDSTVMRAHQHAAGARKAHEGLGRSRGGFTTKVPLSVDGRCRPLSVVVTPDSGRTAPSSSRSWRSSVSRASALAGPVTARTASAPTRHPMQLSGT